MGYYSYISICISLDMPMKRYSIIRVFLLPFVVLPFGALVALPYNIIYIRA